MTRKMVHRLGSSILGLGILAGVVIAARAADRPAATILEAIDALKPPELDSSKRSNQTYYHRHLSKVREVATKRDALILELYKAHPKHERIPELMGERWGRKEELSKATANEIDLTLAKDKNPKLRVEAIFVKARAKLHGHRAGAPDLALMNQFLELAPKDPRGATLLRLAIERTKSEKAKSSLENRLERDFAGIVAKEKSAPNGDLKNAIGRPFALEFKDAISGKTVSIKGLKGKVVVIDFWATWCGPCVGEMPNMKKIYAAYRDQGVEFIGVSLDAPEKEGGLEKLRNFVREKKIDWPQYYQGDGWNSAFSKSWGINGIPCVFVVDQNGRLYSTDARGKLEKIIPGLLHTGLASAGGGN
jgi:thiol-disulfide isomerase/thioredoxin